MNRIDDLRKSIVEVGLKHLDEQSILKKNPFVVEVVARLITRDELAKAHEAGYVLHYCQNLDYEEKEAAAAAFDLKEMVRKEGMKGQEKTIERTRELVKGIPGPLPNNKGGFRSGRAFRY